MRTNYPVLLVEDDDVDVLSVIRAFKELQIPNQLIVRKNGEEALDYLSTNETLPGLILLDLNMPKIGGLELLKTLKRSERLQLIPAVVLTTSSNHRDIELAYKHQAAGYLVKPMDFTEFKESISHVFKYWSLCELPEFP